MIQAVGAFHKRFAGGRTGACSGIRTSAPRAGGASRVGGNTRPHAALHMVGGLVDLRVLATDMDIAQWTIPDPWLVTAAFAASCATTILLILRRPSVRVTVVKRTLRIDTYFLGALFGAILLVAAGALDYGQVRRGLGGSGRLQPLGILALFLSMVFISAFLDITGIFEYFARLALRFARSDGRRLFFSLYCTVSVLTIFTSNDIIILTFTPFVYYFAREADLNPVPYLVAEFFAANTWSMMLYIGNPTNIVIASAFDLRFLQYTAWMFLPTVTAGAVNAGMLYVLFRREITKPIVRRDDIDPSAAITDRSGAVIGGIMLACCVVGLAIAPYLHLEMWLVALCFALALMAALLIRGLAGFRADARPGQVRGIEAVPVTLRRMPWAIVPFVLSLFVTVEALHVYGVTASVGRFFHGPGTGSGAFTSLVHGIGSALSANVLNNIPMTVAFTHVMSGLSGRPLLGAALATAVGSNLGANITPIGALAGIMWMSILRQKGCPLSFGRFMLYGVLITPLALIACLAVLALELYTVAGLAG